MSAKRSRNPTRILLTSDGDKRDSIEVTKYTEDSYLFFAMENGNDGSMVVLDRKDMIALLAWLAAEAAQ